MAKKKAKTKAKAKAPAARLEPRRTYCLLDRLAAIKLIVKDTIPDDGSVFEIGWNEYEVSLTETLSDLLDFITTGGEDAADGEDYYFTTLEGKRIPMTVKIAKLMQDGLISDGSYILIQVRGWPLIFARPT